jgi:hypothetical protein
MLALKKNPALLAKLGKTPGARMKNATAALPFGAAIGSSLGQVGMRKED